MSKGVQFLMKKNKLMSLTVLKLKPVKLLTLEKNTLQIISSTTGARSELPSLPQDGKKVIGYDKP